MIVGGGHGAYCTCPMPYTFIDIHGYNIWHYCIYGGRGFLSLTGLRTLGLSLWLLASSVVPGCAISTNEAGDSLGVDILAIDAEGRLFALGSALLLLAEHQVDLLCLDIFADMPCGEAIFVLLFSGGFLG